MLYNVVIIDKDTASNRDKLVVSLYKFLNRYVPSRLIYENRENIEDAVQDTIMFILKRFDELILDIEKVDPEWQDMFNYEKYFYNRARSYLSYWIRKKKRDRKNMREYIETAIYLKEYMHNDIIKPIDLTTLERITKEYNFKEVETQLLNDITINMLEGMGYTNIEEKEYYLSPGACGTTTDLLKKIAYNVVDEYLVITIGEKY